MNIQNSVTFKQYVSKASISLANIEDIVTLFIQTFDNACREWLGNPDTPDKDILEYQNSAHWVQRIGEHFGRVIGIARRGVGGQLVAVLEKRAIWLAWLAKIGELTSHEHFQQTRDRINGARTQIQYDKTIIGTLLGSDTGALDVFKKKMRK